MSIIGLLCLLFALIAALVLVLYALQRRDMKSVVELSQQLQRIAIGGRLAGRVEIGSDKPELAALATAVNHLLTRAAPGPEREALEAPKLFADLGVPPIDPVIDRGMICGSSGMLKDTKDLLEKAGLNEGANSKPAEFVIERAFVG